MDYVQSGAEFSACGRYRYKLWRVWDAAQPPVMFIMLNSLHGGRQAE